MKEKVIKYKKKKKRRKNCLRSETFALGIRTVSGNIRIERLGGRCIAISMKKSTWNKNFIKLTRMVNTFIFMTTPETRHRFVIPDTQKFIFGFLVFTLMKALSVCKSPIRSLQHGFCGLLTL